MIIASNLLIPEMTKKVLKGAVLGYFAGLVLFRGRNYKSALAIYGGSFGLGVSLNDFYTFHQQVQNTQTGTIP